MTSLSPLLRTKLSPRFRLSTFHIPLSSSPISQSVSNLTPIGLLGFEPSRTYSTDTSFLEDVSKRFTIRRSSILSIKRKAHLQTMTFYLHDAVDKNEVFYTWRTVMQLKNEWKDIPCIFGPKLPNVLGIVKPLELIRVDQKLFIVYDQCSSIPFIEFVKGNFTQFVGKGAVLLSPAVNLIRTLVQVAVILEESKCNYFLNEKLIFLHEEHESPQIMLDIFGGKNNFNVIADVVEAYFGEAQNYFELRELLYLLRTRQIDRNNIHDVAILATGTITRRLSCLSEALTKDMGFRMEFNEKYCYLRGWKRFYPYKLKGYSNTPYSLIKCFRNKCFHKHGSEFHDWTTMDIINLFRTRYPHIICILFTEFSKKGLIE